MTADGQPIPARGDDLQALADRLFESWRRLVRGPATAVSAAFYGEGDDECNVAQIEVLEILLDHDGLRMSELANRAQVEPSTMTRTIDRMTRNCLVERTSDPDDDRVVVVRTTEAGADRCRRVLRDRSQFMREYVLVMGEEPAAALAPLLERFVDGVAQTVDRHRSTREGLAPGRVPVASPASPASCS